MIRFFRSRLNFKIFSSFMLIIFVSTVGSLVIAYLTIRATLDREIHTRLADSMSAFSRELGFVEERCLRIARELAAEPDLAFLLASGRLEALKTRLVHYYRLGVFDIIEIEDRRGRVAVRGHHPELLGDLKIDQAIVQEGLSGRSGVSFEQGRSGVAVRAVAPLESGGEVIGVLMVGSLFSEQFVEHIKLLTGLENGIYRGGQKVIATYGGADTLAAEVLEALRSAQTVYIRRTTLSERASSLLLQPLRQKNGSYWGALALGLAQGEEHRYLRYSQTLLLLMIGIGVLLAFAIYLTLARNIDSSLTRILAGMDGFSLDRFDTRIEVASRDEFGLIAEAFNRLAHKLQLYYRRIRRLQEDMIRSAKLATAGQIAAGMAHEIRNPLSSIRMMAQMLRSRHLEAGRGRTEINTILSETDRLNDLTRDLLEFARPSPMRFARHDPNRIIEGVLGLVRYNTEHQGIEVVADLDRSLPTLYADGEKLRLVILNLVLNAIQAMPEGGTLEVHTGRRVDGRVLMRVCNNGPAIPQEHLSTIFEPFFTTKKEGTGLGLALVRMVIERHFGTVQVRSREGRTCFTVLIPEDIEEKERVL
jgi:signal transduction histidine kinase